jgi:hypothetical protein
VVAFLQSFPTRIDVNKSKSKGFEENEKDLGKVAEIFFPVLVSFRRDMGFVEKK